MENNKNLTEDGQDLALYKFYLELVLKVAVFVFSITGALVSYYLANAGENEYLKFSLALPMVMNAGLAMLCALSAPSAMELRRVQKTYELIALPLLLWLFAATYALVTAGLLLLWILDVGSI